jgi:GT2 family glycosyltransferase
MGLGSSVGGLYAAAERRAGWLLVGGLATAAIWNLRGWHRDRRRLAQLEHQKPVAYALGRTPRVSILVPAWNGAGTVGPCIESILGLHYPDVELIVSAGGSDGTMDIALRYEGSRVIILEQTSGEGKQGALRRCYARSTGEVIFLTDADCFLDDTCFEKTLGPVIAGREDAATGSWRPLERQRDQPFVQYQWSHHVYRELWMPAYAPALDGRNAAVKRPALDEVGAFEIPAPTGTDLALSRQLRAAGYSIRFVRESRVQTEYPETPGDYRRQLSRWFRNPLVHDQGWLSSPSARRHLWAGLAATVLLVAPLPALFSGLLRSLWIGSVLHLWMAQLRTYAVMQHVMGPEAPPSQRLRNCRYLPLGWALMAESLWSFLCLPKKAEQW